MDDKRDNKCKYCGAELPLTYEGIATKGESVDCPGCHTRYTPVIMAGIMGSGVEIYDDGPPPGIGER